MTDPTATLVARARSASAPGGAYASGLSTEATASAGRRLAWVALAYLILFLFVSGPELLAGGRGWIEPARSLVAIGGALAVFWIGRSGRCPPGVTLPDVAVAFQVFAALVPADWDLIARAEAGMREFAAALGIEGTRFVTDFVEPLVAHGIRPGATSRPTWLGVWILVFPFIFPMTFRRTLLSSSLTAIAGLAPVVLPILFLDEPAWMSPWVPGGIADIAVPTLVCLVLALATSRVIYRVSVDLDRERRMGSYHLTEKIGEGGMGEVWRARHRYLARPAAIKLIRPESLEPAAGTSGEVLVRRFENEAQATAMLTSPHTVELYDFGRTDDGTFYYVMELLEGLDLRTLVERHGPVPAERAIFFLVQACHSLGEAHDAGLVHRDVKPANLFACRRGPDLDRVKVLDFGLVKRQWDEGREDAQLTTAGSTTGTPAFLPPEAAEGGRAIDGRADLYALGCVAYWLITGRLVFEAKDALGMIVRHVRDRPAPPSEVTELEVPGALDEVILDCLAKDPASRPESAWVLRERLRRIAAELPEWGAERAGRWWSVRAGHG